MKRFIEFEPTNKEAEILFPKPTPALECLPEWYRSMPVHLGNEEKTGLSPDGVASSNLTLKGCMPFLDAISFGYSFTLPFDIELRRNRQGMVGIRWATNIDFVGQHGQDQAPGLPTPFGGSPNILKWRPGWRVITPPGYSCFFTHPVNHIDLPFTVISGVVDTDSYGLGVEIPFKLLDFGTDLTILEKGTPICQVIPFKRENWESKQVPFDEETQKKNGFMLKSKIVRSYQTQFWKKKSFK